VVRRSYQGTNRRYAKSKFTFAAYNRWTLGFDKVSRCEFRWCRKE